MAEAWGSPMVAGGLKATRNTMFSPFDIPPWMPPLLFVAVRMRPSRHTKASLWADPCIVLPWKPLPTSNPCTISVQGEKMKKCPVEEENNYIIIKAVLLSANYQHKKIKLRKRDKI
jgi:hypothetical protein